jgi:hypothetical protein
LQNFPANTTDIHGNMDLGAHGFATPTAFIQAIQNRCVEYLEKIHANAGESAIQTRQRLLTVNLYDEVRQLIAGAQPGGGGLVYMIRNIVRPVVAAPGGGVALAPPPPPPPPGALTFDNAFKSYLDGLNDPHRWSRVGVTFHGEAGIDMGGLRKEYLGENIKEIKRREIFMEQAGSHRRQINPAFNEFAFCTAGAQPANEQNCYANIGRLIGKYLLTENEYIPLNLPLYYLHRIIGSDFRNLVDLLAILKLDEPAYFQSMMRTLGYDAATLAAVVLDFDGLLPGGNLIDVDANNVYQYVQRHLRKKIIDDQAARLDPFLAGIAEWIPAAIFQSSGINALDLKLLLQGVGELRVADIRAVSDLANAASQQVIWFWEVIQELANADPTVDFLAQLMSFWTSTPTLPANVAAQPLQINITLDNTANLPISHTCFNKLDIPRYPTKEILKTKLFQAVMMSSGFHIAHGEAREALMANALPRNRS